MQWFKRLRNRHARRWCGIVLVACVGLLGWAFQPLSPRAEFAWGKQRWGQSQLRHYRIDLQIETFERVCRQQIEARNGRTERVLMDTCNTSWLSALTVDQLFSINQRIDQSSAARCYPSDRACSCRRVVVRHVAYNPQFGYPELLSYERGLAPNWLHSDFWRRWIDAGSMPQCSMPARNLRIAVLSLQPLP